MMTVYFLISYKGHTTQGYVMATRIIRKTKHTIRFEATDGSEFTMKKSDILTIEYSD